MTRSPNRDSRSPAIHRALGSRSRPISRRPGNSVRNRSACPPAPSVASTRTAPLPSGSLSGQRGRQQLDAAVEQDGNVPVIGSASGILRHRNASDEGPCTEVPVRESRTWRWGSTPGPVRTEATMHGQRAGLGGRRSDDVVQSFIAGRGEVLFVGLLVFLPRLGDPRSPGSQPIRSPRTPWTGWRSGGDRPTA